MQLPGELTVLARRSSAPSPSHGRKADKVSHNEIAVFSLRRQFC